VQLKRERWLRLPVLNLGADPARPFSAGTDCARTAAPGGLLRSHRVC
jgi:hypothetical protein